MQEILEDKEIAFDKNRLSFRESTSRKVSPLEQLQPIVATITRITRRALKATASSVLICGANDRTLNFLFADGLVGSSASRLRISKQTGIAGWVARNGNPLIVNDIIKSEYFSQYVDQVTGYKTKSVICAPLVTAKGVIGVIEVLNKVNSDGFSENDLQTLMTAAAATAQVIENLRQTRMSVALHRITIKALLSAVDARKTCTHGHAGRVSEYALMGATALSLSNEEMHTIEYAAILHDIGNLGLPDSLLNESDTITSEERGMIRKHPIIGFNLLKGIAFLEEASRLVLYHHERYDGKGYPKGLTGHVIPIGSRLIAVADAFDNMTTEQSNRAALGKKDAFIELHKYAGSKFDPTAVKAFYSGYTKSLLAD